MKHTMRVLWVGVLAVVLAACANQSNQQAATQTEVAGASSPAASAGSPSASPSASPFPLEAGWWDNAVCYEVFVRSFRDSNGDGIGDLNGLIEKLDYINDGNPDAQNDFGAPCIWLMPITEAASYHGYDVVDYYKVEADYGTNDDFKRLIEEAHKRGINVILDLVLNHTSREHPWFKDAASNPDSPYRDWYIWSQNNPGYRGPWGDVAWHQSSARSEYYYGVFWEGMPDLNYRNPQVTAEAQKISLFWLNEMGADGFRLDAIKHLIEDGQTQENTPETHAWLRDYRRFLEENAPEAFTIGEIFGSTVINLKPYYPDQLDTYFQFEVGGELINAANTGSALPFNLALTDVSQQLPFQRWAPFLTNHDQNRVFDTVGKDAGKMRIAATALLTLPGLPFVYYGEEIGMSGSKPDERIRTPMQWSGETPGGGFTSGEPWQPFQANFVQVNAAAQENDPNSLLNLYRRMIHLHTSHPALGQGEIISLKTSSNNVAAFVRQTDEETLLVVLNFGTQAAEGVVLQADPAQFEPSIYTLEPLLGGTTQEARVSSTADTPDTLDVEPLQRLDGQTGYVFTMTK